MRRNNTGMWLLIILVTIVWCSEMRWQGTPEGQEFLREAKRSRCEENSQFEFDAAMEERLAERLFEKYQSKLNEVKKPNEQPKPPSKPPLRIIF